MPITLKLQKICRVCIANAGGVGWPSRTRAYNIFMFTSVMPLVLVVSPNSPQTPRTHTKPHSEPARARARVIRFVMPVNIWGGLLIYGIYTNTDKPAQGLAKVLPPVSPH